MFNQLSPKQIQSYNESNSRLNIWEGAVRSGKSFASLLRFIKFIRYGPPGRGLITGKTQDTVKLNVILPLQDLLGTDLQYKAGTREVILWGRQLYVVGASDERAETKIRGTTFAGAYADELTLIPESFFKMMLSRLSVDGAQLFGTTNPDSPFHWLKKEYLDRKDLDMSLFKFNMEDNPSLTEIYKNNLKKEFAGLFYERYIEGKWVLAEGTVYDFFDASLHVINSIPGNADYYIISIDYGTSNPTVFSLIGYSDRTYPRMWLEREYRWDSRKEMKQKSDYEYALDLKEFVSNKKVVGVYVDPSASSLKVELQRLNLPVFDANNDVLSGIRYHGMLLQNGDFKICSNCKYSIEEYGTYRWDDKAQQRGEDKPLKQNDHHMDSIRYGLFTHFFPRQGNRMSADDLEKLKIEAYGSRPDHGKFFEDRYW